MDQGVSNKDIIATDIDSNKIMILTQVSLLAALGGLNTATINPALVELGKEFGISTVHASYQT